MLRILRLRRILISWIFFFLVSKLGVAAGLSSLQGITEGDPISARQKLHQKRIDVIGDVTSGQGSNYLSDLDALDRHERQIRFKGSYQELPESLPHQEIDDGNPYNNEQISYFIQVEVEEEPLIEMDFRNLPSGVMTYFPPEVIPLDLLDSSEGGRNDHNDFYTFQNEPGTIIEGLSSEEQNFVDSPRTATISPYYIPTIGDTFGSAERSKDTDGIHEKSDQTEKPIFLAKDITTSQTYHPTPSPLTSQEDSYSTVPSHPTYLPSRYEPPKELKINSSVLTRERQLDSQSVLETISPSFHPNAQNLVPITPLTIPESAIPIFLTKEDDNENTNGTDTSTYSTPRFKETSISHNIPGLIRTLIPPYKESSLPISTSKTYNDVNPSLLAPPRSLSLPSKLPYNSAKTKQETIVKTPRDQKYMKNNGQAFPRTGKNLKGLDRPRGSAIPGIGGIDYPAFLTLPETNFDCSTKIFGGYYADVEAQCQVFHVCVGRKSAAFICPVGTLFNQRLLVCDWWYNVDCPPKSVQLNGPQENVSYNSNARTLTA